VNKKEAKKLWPSESVPLSTPVAQIKKVFCFFFTKKKSSLVFIDFFGPVIIVAFPIP